MSSKNVESFSGHYRFLSNFWPSELLVAVGEDVYVANTVEHAFQASKPVSNEQQIAILEAKTPGEAKRLGKACTLRPEWADEQFRIRTMRELVLEKFTRHDALGRKLLETGDLELVEGNTWGDTFWGVCEGVGTNWLGRILMDVRKELERREDQSIGFGVK